VKGLPQWMVGIGGEKRNFIKIFCKRKVGNSKTKTSIGNPTSWCVIV
jgi:hypothetical protein